MISMKSVDWNFKFSKGVPKHPIIEGEGWKFSVPTSQHPGGKTVNYLNTNKFDKLKVGQLLSMTFKVVRSEDVKFECGFGEDNPGLRPGNVRFYLQKGKSLSNAANSRWWSNPISYDLVDAGEEVTISVRLEPAEWSNVWGYFGDANEKTILGFSGAVERAGKIGVTFGGGSFFGHGVWLSRGSAEFIMKAYEIH